MRSTTLIGLTLAGFAMLGIAACPTGSRAAPLQLTDEQMDAVTAGLVGVQLIAAAIGYGPAWSAVARIAGATVVTDTQPLDLLRMGLPVAVT